MSDSGIDLLNNVSQPGGVERMDENNPPNPAGTSNPSQSSRGGTTGELSRGRRRRRSTDAGMENGNESDMDLELLAESESDSDEDVVPPSQELSTEGYESPSNPCVVSRCVLYSEDDSSSGDEDVVDNDIDQVEEDEEIDEDGGRRDENENSGTRVLDVHRTGEFKITNNNDGIWNQ